MSLTDSHLKLNSLPDVHPCFIFLIPRPSQPTSIFILKIQPNLYFCNTQIQHTFDFKTNMGEFSTVTNRVIKYLINMSSLTWHRSKTKFSNMKKLIWNFFLSGIKSKNQIYIKNKNIFKPKNNNVTRCFAALLIPFYFTIVMRENSFSKNIKWSLFYNFFFQNESVL